MAGPNGRYASSPEPARRLREALHEQRRQGADFASAWRASVPIALAGVVGDERKEWRLVFREMRGTWAMAYARVGRIPAPLPLPRDQREDGARYDALLVA